MTNHENRRSVNSQEAGAFALHCRLLGISTAEALAELAITTWPGSADHPSHTPTVRRLAKPLLLKLDEEHAAAAVYRAAKERDIARWVALSPAAKAAIREAAASAPVTISNKAARDAATHYGITVYAGSIDNLRSLIDPRNPWNM